MNSLQIYNCCKNLPVFGNVLALDEFIKLKIKRGKAYIVNTDPSYAPGTHWLLIFFPVNQSPFYFDTFGIYPQNLEIAIKLKKYKKWYFNNKLIQNFNSDVCGKYVCVLMMYIQKYKRPDQFLNLFTNNLEKNDKLIVTLFKKYFVCPGKDVMGQSCKAIWTSR